MGAGMDARGWRLLSRLNSMYVYCTHAWGSQRSEEDAKYPETGIMNNCEPSCGCWEPRQDPLQEQSVLLAVEPSLQPWVSAPDSAGLESPRQLITCIWSASHVVPLPPRLSSVPVYGLALCRVPQAALPLDTDKTVCTYDVDVTELWEACPRCSYHCK